jgi:hypothetical protein
VTKPSPVADADAPDRGGACFQARDLSTTMIYTHVTTVGGKGVRSALDDET